MTNDDEPQLLLAQQPRKIFAYSVGAGAAVIALTFLGWGLTRPSKDTELAQWFPAVAGGLTLIAAVVAAIFAAGAFRLEYRREIRILDEAERAQAQSFVGWVTRGGIGRSGGDNGVLQFSVGAPTIFLRNASNLPVYDITFKVKTISNEPGIHGYMLPDVNIRLVPPNETERIVRRGVDFAVAAPPGFDGNTPMPTIDFAVAVQFRDTAGRYWRRHGNGDFEKGAGDLRF